MIGGAAGCFPVLVGWAAVKGTIAIPAMVLFAVIFLWTPPHFWALAMKFKDDYARANVPMLPVVASPAAVTRKIVGYSYAMVAATLALAPYAGWLYTAAAVGLGAWFLLEAHRLHAQVAAAADRPFPMRLFHLSIAYLTLLFAAVAVALCSQSATGKKFKSAWHVERSPVPICATGPSLNSAEGEAADLPAIRQQSRRTRPPHCILQPRIGARLSISFDHDHCIFAISFNHLIRTNRA